VMEKVFGDYNVIKQIGQGSLGTVYLAEHCFMKKHYALKVLPQELVEDRSFIQRFEEEISLLSTLDHPYLVKYHNVSYADGAYFIVMDCVVDSIGETTNLSQYLANRTTPWQEDELLSLLEKVAEALDYCHTVRGDGVLHQRLKLNNILMGADDKVYLSDYGLAKIIGLNKNLSRLYRVLSESTGVLSATDRRKLETDDYSIYGEDIEQVQRLHSSFLQNYYFLAPEQKNILDIEKVGPQSDSYAFGVLVYYLITREFPEGVFDMPSRRFPHYKKNWDLLVWNCLQKAPERRPTSLVNSLRQMLEQQGKMSFSHSSMAKKPSGVATKTTVPVSSIITKHTIEKKIEAEIVVPDPVPVAVAPVAERQSLKPVISRPKEELRPQIDDDPAAIFREDLHVTQYRPKPVETKEVEPILTEMVVVPEGQYARGSNSGNRDEMPVHAVYLDSFAIDLHAATNEQFIRFLEWMGGEKDSNNNDIIRLRESRIRRNRGKLSIESGYSKHPVVGVTWYGAVAYSKWVGKRLPTEAEWEIACLGGLEGIVYPTGENIESNQSNFFSADTIAVMSYAPNSYGVYDVVGNVYEWCQDWYGYNYYEASQQEPENPKGPLQGVYRVLRGGCWKSLKEDMRCSHRHRNNPWTFNKTYGFRCAADVTSA
jgi:formylglycine-generating enzyme required for sulfatase activity